jgi:NADH pyrophosphatase NudC (nudix superfamily)
MDLGSLLALLALLLLVGFFVARPLLDNSPASRAALTSAQDHAFSHLAAERERLLDTLQELDFDFKLGKIPAEEYPQRRTLLLQQGAEILKQLDSLAPPADNIEAAIIQRRAALPEPARRQPVAEDDDIETLLAARRRARTGQSAGFCPQCGSPVQQTDKFCAKCGKAL